MLKFHKKKRRIKLFVVAGLLLVFPFAFRILVVRSASVYGLNKFAISPLTFGQLLHSRHFYAVVFSYFINNFRFNYNLNRTLFIFLNVIVLI